MGVWVECKKENFPFTAFDGIGACGETPQTVEAGREAD
jgi:hypothetical protein